MCAVRELDAATANTLETVDRFNKAFNSHDVDAIMALMTDDCIFESTGPAPDGVRYEGQEAIRAVWDSLFGGAPEALFTAEEIIATGDRCVVRWHFSFGHGHVRGVDVIRIRGGKLAEKLSYVKG